MTGSWKRAAPVQRKIRSLPQAGPLPGLASITSRITGAEQREPTVSHDHSGSELDSRG